MVRHRTSIKGAISATKSNHLDREKFPFQPGKATIPATFHPNRKEFPFQPHSIQAAKCNHPGREAVKACSPTRKRGVSRHRIHQSRETATEPTFQNPFSLQTFGKVKMGQQTGVVRLQRSSRWLADGSSRYRQKAMIHPLNRRLIHQTPESSNCMNASF